MNRSFFLAINDNKTLLLTREVQKLFQIEDFLHQYEDNVNHYLEIDFQSTGGFYLNLISSEDDKSPTSRLLMFPGDLLNETWETEIESRFIDIHSDFGNLEDISEKEEFESHLDQSCPVCREEKMRIFMELENQLTKELEFYIDDIIEIGEELLTNPDNYLQNFLITINSKENSTEIHFNINEFNFGELEDLDFGEGVLFDIGNLILENLPVIITNEVKAGSKVEINKFNGEIKINSEVLSILLKHTNLQSKDLELYLTDHLLNRYRANRIYPLTSDDRKSSFEDIQYSKTIIQELFSDFNRIFQFN